MKLNFGPRHVYAGALAFWVVLLLVVYTPVTSWVTKSVLSKFRPIAYSGKSYELTVIDKNTFSSKSESFGSDLDMYEYDIGSDVGSLDGRAAALRKYLRDQGSPLMPHAELIVREADIHGLDWRLVPAISGIESRFCRIRPADTNNCWGWRGGPGGSWQKFETLEVGVKVLTDRLANGYGRNLTPYDIEPTYCPPCAASGHSWAHAVTQYMAGMQMYLEKSRVSQ